MLQRIHDSLFFFFGTGHHSGAIRLAFTVVFMLVDTQLLTNLFNVSRVNLEAVLLLDVLLDVIVAVESVSIDLQLWSA